MIRLISVTTASIFVVESLPVMRTTMVESGLNRRLGRTSLMLGRPPVVDRPLSVVACLVTIERLN